MLQLKRENDYAVIQLDNGIPNALSSEVIDRLDSLLQQVAGEQAPLVLAGNSKFFSMGLNLPEVIDFTPDQFTRFINKFDQLVHTLYTLPVPVACALEGHAAAGGAILALACDVRIGADESKKIGCNEAQLGVPVPYLPSMIFRQIASDALANTLMYQGSMLSFQDAFHHTILNELVPSSEVIAAAGERAKQMAAASVEAFAVMKNMRTGPVSERFHADKDYYTEQFVRCWYQQTSQELIRQAAQRF